MKDIVYVDGINTFIGKPYDSVWKEHLSVIFLHSNRFEIKT
jgi:hypothetical protein